MIVQARGYENDRITGILQETGSACLVKPDQPNSVEECLYLITVL